MSERKPHSPVPATYTFSNCLALVRDTIKQGIGKTWFERSPWFLETDLVAMFVREGCDPNDKGERVIAARECLTRIAKQSQDDPKPLQVLLGAARGQGVLKAPYEHREDLAMKQLRRRDKRYFRYTTRPRWEREVALELYRELTEDDS